MLPIVRPAADRRSTKETSDDGPDQTRRKLTDGTARLAAALGAFCLIALITGCTGSYGGGTMGGPSGAGMPDRQSNGGGSGRGSGGGGGGY